MKNKENGKNHPEIKNIKNICDVSPKAKITKDVCDIVHDDKKILSKKGSKKKTEHK